MKGSESNDIDLPWLDSELKPQYHGIQHVLLAAT